MNVNPSQCKDARSRTHNTVRFSVDFTHFFGLLLFAFLAKTGNSSAHPIARVIRFPLGQQVTRLTLRHGFVDILKQRARSFVYTHLYKTGVLSNQTLARPPLGKLAAKQQKFDKQKCPYLC